jgi:hypothetical protein
MVYLKDHWKLRPQPDWWWGAVLAILVFLILIGMGAFAFAHMHDRPDLDAWFNGLQSSGGYPCCSSGDSDPIADVDWDTTVIDGKSYYRVRVDGKWITVTDQEVVKIPNRYGRPLVWVYRDITGVPKVRCFMPGAGG